MIKPGDVINQRYRIIRLLGEGGMGAVYEAENTGVGRKVALKFLRSEFARNQEVLERFQREARAAGAIGHDNIIDVIDVGVHDDAPFMVLEYLRGQSLRDRIENTTDVMSPSSACYIMGQVLSALGAAHDAGIVHRDLKPDNVFLVSKNNVHDFVKLLDFGISKFSGEKAEGKSLTQTGALIGTPYYMAPEQALAKRDIDHRADLYSAGVMLYQMVTGVLPFDAESQAELLMQIIYQPNGIKPPRELRPDLPPEFEAVILKAMSKDKTQRFENAASFAAALAPWGATSAVQVPEKTGQFKLPSNPNANQYNTVTPVTWQKDTPASTAATALQVPRRRSRGLLYAGGGAAVLLVGAGIMLVTQMHGAVPVPSSAIVAPHPATQNQASLETSATTQTQAQAPEQNQPSATASFDLQNLPPDAVITVDGATVVSPHLTFPRGSVHSIRVTAPGKEPFETSVTAERDVSLMVAMATASENQANSQPAAQGNSTNNSQNTAQTGTPNTGTSNPGSRPTRPSTRPGHSTRPNLQFNPRFN